MTQRWVPAYRVPEPRPLPRHSWTPGLLVCPPASHAVRSRDRPCRTEMSALFLVCSREHLVNACDDLPGALDRSLALLDLVQEALTFLLRFFDQRR